MRTAITLTTINIPTVLEKYIRNIKQYGHRQVDIIVVGDLKSPAGTKEYCESLVKKYSVSIQYLDTDDQVNYLSRFPELDKYLPHNSFARRNIADLIAYEEGYQSIIRVDDDNYPIENDFIDLHNTFDTKVSTRVIATDVEWYNICEELVDKDKIPFYPRGFPYDKRWIETDTIVSEKNIEIKINAGLWLGDPDVDAITRLCKYIDAAEYKGTHGERFALELGTWCPINTQNTAYSRDIIPAIFVPPHVGRYDDIWSGYLTRKIMDHFGHYVTYGQPLLFQDRNEHNLWNDLENEVNGNVYTPHLIETLRAIDLKGTSYLECYYELAEGLMHELEENRSVFNGVIDGMKVWVQTLDKLNR